MDWQRERDGLVVAGTGIAVLALAVTGRGLGMAATFVATFLGVLVAFRVESVLADEPSDDAVHRERPAAASPTSADEPPTAEPADRTDAEEPVD